MPVHLKFLTSIAIVAAATLIWEAQPVSAANTTLLQTRIGDLTLDNGYPSRETAGRLYDEMDFQRATQAYL
jgi:hypothetical protein